MGQEDSRALDRQLNASAGKTLSILRAELDAERRDLQRRLRRLEWRIEALGRGVEVLNRGVFPSDAALIVHRFYNSDSDTAPVGEDGLISLPIGLEGEEPLKDEAYRVLRIHHTLLMYENRQRLEEVVQGWLEGPSERPITSIVPEESDAITPT